MTIPEFLEQLRATPGPWRVTTWGGIRCMELCPIRALRPGVPLLSVAAVLGLGHQDVLRIIRAADNQWDETRREHAHDRALRQQLLAVTVERTP